MRHIKKQNSSLIFPDGPRENVVPGPRWLSTSLVTVTATASVLLHRW